MARIPNDDIVRKDLPVIFVIDTSGSMSSDGKMTQVNRGMRETVEILKDFSKKNADSNLKIGILKFSSGSEWVTNDLEPFSDFEYEDLEAGGMTALGDALNKLNSKLDRHGDGFLGTMIGAYMPIIIFLTDGMPNDEWEKPLKNIWENNKWYKHKNTTKIGIAIGGDADENVLISVVGTNEAVCRVNDLTILGTLLRCIAVTSSMTKSSPQKAEGELTSGAMLKDGIAAVGDGKAGVKIVDKPDPGQVVTYESGDGGTWGAPEEW